ncbi:MAG: SGNH/GDSL hydrolase family protein [Candidatus Binatia bacterium]
MLVSAALAACGGGGGGSSRGVSLRDLNADGDIEILAFGDSITRGQGDGAVSGSIPPGIGGYPGRLQEMLGVPVINAGVQGEDTSEGLARLRGLLASTDADYVIILQGALDIENRRTEEAARNLEAMVDLAQADGADVLIGTVLPTCCTHRGIIPNGSINTLNSRIVEIADRTSIPVIDFHRAFVPSEDAPYDESSGLLHLPDGLHPTPTGYDVMASTAAQAFQ